MSESDSGKEKEENGEKPKENDEESPREKEIVFGNGKDEISENVEEIAVMDSVIEKRKEREEYRKQLKEKLKMRRTLQLEQMEAEQLQKEIEKSEKKTPENDNNVMESKKGYIFVETPNPDELDFYGSKMGLLGYLTPSSFLFLWMFPSCVKGFLKSALRMKDIPALEESMSSSHCEEKFENGWDSVSNDSPFSNFRFTIALLYVFLVETVVAGTFKIFGCLFSFLVPIFLYLFLSELRPPFTDELKDEMNQAKNVLPPSMIPDSDDHHANGFRNNYWSIWLYLIGLCLCQIISFLFNQRSSFVSLRIGSKIRVLLQNTVLKKILMEPLNSDEPHWKSLSLLMEDVYHIDRCQMHLWSVVSSAMRIVFTYFFLLFLLGSPSLYAVFSLLGLFSLIMILAIPLHVAISVIDQPEKKGKQIHHLWEMISPHSRLIKSFKWEDRFKDRVITETFETKFECLTGKLVSLILSLISSLGMMFLPIICSITLAAYCINNDGSKMEPVEWCTAVALFLLLGPSFIALSKACVNIVWGSLAIHHFQLFLKNQSEKKNESRKCERIISEDGKFDDKLSTYAIEIVNGWFGWERDGNSFFLKGLNLCVRKGSLTMIVGPDSCGKTTLIECIRGRLSKIGKKTRMGVLHLNYSLKEQKERCFINGSLFCCPEMPFLINGTVKENVVFMEKAEEEVFRNVASICRLEDISHIEVDEEGYNVSLGEAHRISLARVLYGLIRAKRMAEEMNHEDFHPIIVLDCILRHFSPVFRSLLFKRIILEQFSGCTVLMTTRNYELCPFAHEIFVMRQGRISEKGKYEELMRKENGLFKNLAVNMVETSEMENRFIFAEEHFGQINENKEGEGEEKKQKKIEKEENLKEQEVELEDISIEEKEKKGEQKTKMVEKPTERILQMEEKKKTCLFPLHSPFPSFCSFLPLSKRVFLCLIFPLLIFVFLMYLSASFHLSSFVTQDIYIRKEGSFYKTNVWINSTDGGSSPAYYNSDDFSSSFCSQSQIECTKLLVDIFWDSNYRNGTEIKDGLNDTSSNGIFFGAVAVAGFFLLCYSFLFFQCTVGLWKRPFVAALENLSLLPPLWFSKNPSGRVVARFFLDSSLVHFMRHPNGQLRDFFVHVLIFWAMITVPLIASVLSRGLLAPLMVFPFPFLMLCFYLFIRPSLEMEKLEAVSRSPLFDFSLFLIGRRNEAIPILKSSQKIGKMSERAGQMVDYHSHSRYSAQSFQQMIEQYVGILSIFWLFITLLVVAIICFVLGEVDPESGYFSGNFFLWMGMASAFSLMIPMHLPHLVKDMLISRSEKQVISERMNYYSSKLEKEVLIKKKDQERNRRYNEKNTGKKNIEDMMSDTVKRKINALKKRIESPEDNKKVKGRIDIENFWMKHPGRSSYALRGVSCNILPGEKVMVVGESGSGKTSLLLALSRFSEGEKGKIYFGASMKDQREILGLSCNILRRRISVLPERNTLFEGTLRSNIDPYANRSDEFLWSIIRECGGTAVVKKYGGLNGKVKDFGSNLSMSDRFMISLIRSMVKQGKYLLCLDEFLTFVNKGLVMKIFEAIFQLKMTVMIVCNNMKYLNFFDKVIVMEKGKIVEFEKASVLLRKKDSLLSKFVQLSPHKDEILNELDDDDKNEENEKDEEKEEKEKEKESGEDVIKVLEKEE